MGGYFVFSSIVPLDKQSDQQLLTLWADSKELSDSHRPKEMERDVVSQESDFPIRLVRQGGRDNRNLSKRGKQRRGKRRRSRGPKRKRRRGKKVGRSRLRSLQSVGTRGGKDKSIADEEEEEEEEEDGAGEERRLRRRMKKLRRSRQLYLEQEQYR